VDFDVTAWILAILSGTLAISLVRIRNVKGAIEPAARVLRINCVFAFGGFVIALARFGPDRIPPERNFVSLQGSITTH
jgi:hypothetical protein